LRKKKEEKNKKQKTKREAKGGNKRNDAMPASALGRKSSYFFSL